ncbi:MAG: hypothetical protein OXF42_07160 [Candidatus Dadabacteria bacterium]|nr:hypothetical protein [Candidatus Dadabacteria bacterium]MCY4047863.1 hypothetical protein [Candidatus Dadabacteria bacterium]
MNTVKVSVLGYIEDGHWVAHALEMDVIGVGDDWEGALSELRENICAQVSFARFRGDDSLIFQPAPPRLFQKFRQIREAELRDLVSHTQKKPSSNFRSDDLDIPRNIPENRYASA